MTPLSTSQLTPDADQVAAAAPRSAAAAAMLRELGRKAAPLGLLAGALALIIYGRHMLLVGGDMLWGPLGMVAGAGLFLMAGALVRGATVRRVWVLLLGLASAAAAHVLAGDGPVMEHPVLAPLAWLFGIGLVGAALWRHDTASEPSGQRWSRSEAAGVAALFVGALLVRLIGNDSMPGMLTGDEGNAALAGIDVIAGRLNNPFTIGWFSFPSLFFALPGLAIDLFGRSYGALRTPAALAGALTVVGLYLWARPMFGRLSAALAAGMLAALNYHIHFSRIGLNNAWDGLFVVLVPAVLWRGWQSGRRWYFLLAGALLGLSQYFYTGARLLPLVLIGWCLLSVVLSGWRTLWQRLPNIGSLVAVALAVFLPLGLFFVGHPDEYGAPANRVSLLVSQSGDPSESWLARTSAETGKATWLILAENYRDAFLGFIGRPLRAWYASGQPMLLAAPAALFVLGLTLALVGIRDNRYWIALLLLGGTVSISAITESTPASQRYIIGAPSAALLVGVALASVCRLAAASFAQRQRQRIVVALAFVAMLGIALADLQFYFYEYLPKAGDGDVNTQIVGQLARRLATYPEGAQVYTFTAPRLVYDGFATLPFLAPQVTNTDVLEPLGSPPGWALGAPRTAFVFLPERAAEAEIVKRRYPGGNEQWFYNRTSEQLFLLYEVEGPRS